MLLMPVEQRKTVSAMMVNVLMCYRHIQLGIKGFSQAVGHWDLTYCRPNGDGEKVFKQLKPDGVLFGPCENDSVIQLARNSGNVVGVCGTWAQQGIREFPNVDVDDYQVGVMGAEYFIQKGYRTLGFLGAADFAFSRARQKGFIETAKHGGAEVSVFQQKLETFSLYSDDVEGNPTRTMLEWVRKAPKPFAVLVCNDERAEVLTHLCNTHDINIPDEVAVLGVDNDEHVCSLSTPALSSVIIPWEQIGYRAAELLNQRMNGEPSPEAQYLVAPTGVMERQSTDATAVADADVRQAMQFIRANAHKLISVDDVVNSGTVTRRTLERRFHDALGYTPLEAIRKTKLARAKMLLSMTEFSLNRIARDCGFAHTSWFSKAFREVFGETPAAYRRRAGRLTT
jgi:LacI family transcriptional regulator